MVDCGILIQGQNKKDAERLYKRVMVLIRELELNLTVTPFEGKARKK